MKHRISIDFPKMEQLPAIMEVFRQAREYQKKCGNIQWADDYPSKELIERDINFRIYKAATPSVVTVDGVVAAYFVQIRHDPAYKPLNIFNTDAPYSIIHRLAIADAYRGTGLSYIILNTAARFASIEGAKIFAFDTGVNNEPMKHIAARLGYKNCGVHNFEWGERVVYCVDVTFPYDLTYTPEYIPKKK